MKTIVLRRILTLAFICVSCLVVGIACGISNGDKMIIIMSVIICAVNLCKIWNLKSIEKNKKYIVISGKCVEASSDFAGQYKKYKIQSVDEMYELSLPKSIKLVNNKVYKFYFKEINLKMSEKNKWLINTLLSDSFIGYEYIDKIE